MIGARQAGLRSKGLRPNVAVRPSRRSVQVEDASGTDAETTAIPIGPLSPDTRLGFTVAPEVVYSLIRLLPSSTTNSLSPETAMPVATVPANGIRARFTVAPEVVYLPILLLSLVGLSLPTNKFPPDTAIG